MDQRKKSALLGYLVLVALVLSGTGYAADSKDADPKVMKNPGAAVVEQKSTEPAAQPVNAEDQSVEGAVPQKDLLPTAEPQPSRAAGSDPETKKPGEAEIKAAESPPGSPSPGSEQPVGPSEKTSEQDADALAAPAAQADEVDGAAETDAEQKVSADESQMAEPVEQAVEVQMPIEPDFVRALTSITTGRNDSNPVWSPSGEMIAFERSIGDNREIVVARNDGSIIQSIQCRPADNGSEMEFFMPGVIEETSYNAGISWSPDENRLVFMSNGGSGNYDLYLLPALGNEKTIRLTQNTEKDSHPHWSPVDEQLAFVSGRTGKAEIYLMNLASRQVSVLTNGEKTYLYPQWSPDGRKLALIYGSNENHDIYLIEDIQQSTKTKKALTTWEHDDLRPAWSPDGSKIAFYSNYNPAGDPKRWSIIVVAADGTDPTEGEALAAKVVADNVVPDVERGPAWMPDGRRIVFVKNAPKEYNPIFITDIENPVERPLRTETKMNHDVVCSKTGIIAFRSQTEQWDHIYIARLKDEASSQEPQ